MKTILPFLAKLKDNNHRDWMEANKPEYLKARKEFEILVESLIAEIAKFDPAIQGLLVKDCMFRINRDVRFSNDKSPYKINFSAYIGPGGKKAMKAGYYFHLQPGASFLAGGRFMPDADHLSKIRQEIDYNAGKLLSILDSKETKQYFKGLEGEKLARAPKGYPSDHPQVELLKMKSFLLTTALSDQEIASDGLLVKASNIFKAIYPLNSFLNQAVE